MVLTLNKVRPGFVETGVAADTYLLNGLFVRKTLINPDPSLGLGR